MLKKQLPLFSKGFKKAAAPLQKQIFKKRPPPVLSFTKGKWQSSFRYLKAICDWRGWTLNIININFVTRSGSQQLFLFFLFIFEDLTGGKNSHEIIKYFLNTHESKKPLHLPRICKDRTARQLL